MEQPTLRQYGQKPPELRQNTAFTEICCPPLKVLAEEVWSQEAQAAIETDIGPLQTLKDFKGNPEVSNQSIEQQGISQFNEQCQPGTTSWPQSSQLPQRTTTTSWPQSSQPLQRTTTTSWPQSSQLPQRTTTTSWPQSSQLPQRTTTTSWPQSSQPLQRTTTTSWAQSSQLPQRTTTTSWPQSSQPPQQYINRDVESLPKMVDTGEVIRALRQVVSTQKIKYMHFDGEPVNYISFMHNFETCLEKDNPDN